MEQYVAVATFIDPRNPFQKATRLLPNATRTDILLQLNSSSRAPPLSQVFGETTVAARQGKSNLLLWNSRLVESEASRNADVVSTAGRAFEAS